MSKWNLFIICLCCSLSCAAQNIGVGTSTPAEKLHVAGNIMGDTLKPNVLQLSSDAGDGKILTSDANGNANWKTSNAAGGSIGFGAWGDCATNSLISEYCPTTYENGSPDGYFGISVAISGNYAIVGAEQETFGSNTSPGSASIYEFNGTKWVFKQKLIDPDGELLDKFGHSVAISGNLAIVGAPSDDVGGNTAQGSVTFFQFNGSSWLRLTKFTNANGATGDMFGISVSLSGNFALIGRSGDDVGGNLNQGSANVYLFSGGIWTFMQRLENQDAAAQDMFGHSVAISGNLAVVGAPHDATISGDGSACFFQYNGTTWVRLQKMSNSLSSHSNVDDFGFSVSISGTSAVIGAPGASSVCFFKFNGSLWSEVSESKGGIGISGLGWHVAMSDDYTLIGSNALKAILYRREGARWFKIIAISDPGVEGSVENFGSAIALSAATKRFIIGAFGYGSGYGKVVFGKIN